jgi:hypothetical protein
LKKAVTHVIVLLTYIFLYLLLFKGKTEKFSTNQYEKKMYNYMMAERSLNLKYMLWPDSQQFLLN